MDTISPYVSQVLEDMSRLTRAEPEATGPLPPPPPAPTPTWTPYQWQPKPTDYWEHDPTLNLAAAPFGRAVAERMYKAGTMSAEELAVIRALWEPVSLADLPDERQVPEISKLLADGLISESEHQEALREVVRRTYLADKTETDNFKAECERAAAEAAAREAEEERRSRIEEKTWNFYEDEIDRVYGQTAESESGQ